MGMLVYRSSAGSGKTFTLVKEYLKLCLSTDNPKRYQSIMAVTFTNKAANEMKERVIKALQMLSDSSTQLEGGDKILQEELCVSININREQLSRRASSALKDVLHHYTDFNISTIDKFILKIIRSFAFDFQIPFNFDIELDSDTLLEQAVDAVVEQAGNDKELTQFLLRFVKEQAEEDGNWNVKTTLKNVAQEAIKDEASEHINQLKDLGFNHFISIKNKCDEQIKSYKGKFDQWQEAAVKILNENDITADCFHGKSRGSIHNYFHKTKYFTAASASNQGYFEREDWEHPSCPADKAALINQHRKSLYGYYTNLEQLKQNDGATIIALSEVSKNLFQLALINEIQKQFHLLKEERNFIHISEFNQKVSQIVLEQPIPFIYERIGERFKNYLIDEFQDTSELQWQNLMPLVDNSLSYDEFNLIVGDVKQAIYRWRGGHADQFQNIDQPPNSTNPFVIERSKQFLKALQIECLKTNYRSAKNIVAFNNLFFSALLPAMKYDFQESYYSDYQQIANKKEDAGYVEISLLPKKQKDESDDFMIDGCLQRIQDCLDRGYQYKDIAILARRNIDLTLIGSALNDVKIPILSSVSLSLSKSKEVNFLMSYFSLSSQENSRALLIDILDYIETNAAGKNHFKELLAEEKTAFYKVKKWLVDKGYSIPNTVHLGIYELLDSICFAFNIDKNNPFVQKLLDIALQQNQLRNDEFIQWWEEKKDKLYISSPEGINAVKLMTIHKAKGLEFPIVIFPFANKSYNKASKVWSNSSSLDIGLPTTLITTSKALEDSSFSSEYFEEKYKSILDELNSFYVALTRAAEEMYLLGWEVDPKGGTTITSQANFFLPVIEQLSKNENGHYYFGEKQKNSKTPKESETTNNFVQHSSKDWRDKIKLSYEAPLLWNVPKTSEEQFDEVDPKKQGDLIHKILGSCKNKNELLEVVENLLKQGLVHKTQKQQLIDRCEAVLNDPVIMNWWKEGEHLIEEEFIDKDGFVHRPDRIICTSEKTIVLDFKTGAASNKHQKQLKTYRKVLEEIQYPAIEAYLIYLDPLTITPVD